MTDFEAVDEALRDVAIVLNRDLPDRGPQFSQESKRQFRSAGRALDELAKNDDIQDVANALESANRALSDVFQEWGISNRPISEDLDFIEEEKAEKEAEKLQERGEDWPEETKIFDRTVNDVETEQLQDSLDVLFDHADRLVSSGSQNLPGDTATQRLILMTAVLVLVAWIFWPFGGAPSVVVLAQQVGGSDTTLQEAWMNWRVAAEQREKY
jgi:hypothetical protein